MTKGKSNKSLIPSEKSKIKTEFHQYSMLIHGEKKIGKTTLLSQENTLFLECDPAQNALSIFQIPIKTWSDLVNVIKELKNSPKQRARFDTIVLDGVDIAYQLCLTYKCARMGITHPSEPDDFGLSWGEVRKEFETQIRLLLSFPDMSARFLCHSNWKEVKGRHGVKIDKLVPNLSKQPEEVLVGLIDIWAAYCYSKSRRILIIEGSESVGAGHRVDHAFFYTDGSPICEIDMKHSASEAYATLLDAFNNKLDKPIRKGKLKSKKKVPINLKLTVT